MSKLQNIKREISNMGSGEFQNLCDAYLYKKINFKNIVALGSQPGTTKTTKGTPDTYLILQDDKYILVEYTTWKSGLFKKIREDIEKCLELKRKIEITDNVVISEIMYYHNSSNITVEQDVKLKAECLKEGIVLSIIGVDKISEDICSKYPILAKEYLNIDIDTNQIQTYDDFIRTYNVNRLAAPIDNDFLFRKKEVECIEEKYEKCDLIILYGSAGIGKTKLALHYGKKYSDKHNYKLYFLHSNNLPIYDDLYSYINQKDNYFIVIDDANQLSDLKTIIRYLNEKNEINKCKIKILVTVRDYAVEKIIRDIREIVIYEKIEINRFTDDEIKTIIETTFKITNIDYQKRILEIAEGNARIALLAAKLSISNNLADILDVSQLYDQYYGYYLTNDNIIIDDNMYICAGIIAVFQAVHLDSLDKIIPILDSKNINKDVFLKSIDKLNKLEIVDIYYDKVVKLSEQCFSNYILKKVFYDKKLISLSFVVDNYFDKYKDKIIFTINTLVNIFTSNELLGFVKDEINIIWNKRRNDDFQIYFDFIKSFYRLNYTETLIVLQKIIENEEKVSISTKEIDINDGKNYIHVDDDIINILSGYMYCEDFEAALDLLFLYYKKRPDLYIQFYHAINQSFVFDKYYQDYDFSQQLIFLKKLKKHSDNYKNEFINILFLDIAKEFLKLNFSYSEQGRKRNINLYTTKLKISKGIKDYRKFVWDMLNDIGKTGKYIDQLRLIIETYDSDVTDTSVSVLQYDMEYITNIIKLYFPYTNLNNCILVDNLLNIYISNKLSANSLLNNYIDTKKFKLYKLLKGPSYREYKGKYKKRDLKNKLIREYISDSNLQQIKDIIDISIEIDEPEWDIGDGLCTVFQEVFNQKSNYYIEIIKYYIHKNILFELNTNEIIKNLFTLISDYEVIDLINSYEFKQKNTYLYEYYHELPSHSITEEHLQDFYEFLSSDTDKDIKSTHLRDIDFVDKFKFLDKDVFYKCCKLILDKKEYSSFIIHIYFDLLFNEHHNSPRELINKFSNNYDLLEEMYCELLYYDRYFDYNGIFLKEIYKVKPSILDKYINCIINESYTSFHIDKLNCFYELDNFIDIYNIIFDKLIDKINFLKIELDEYLNKFLLPSDRKILSKQDDSICQYIEKYYNDEIKMYCLFNLISRLNNDRKIKYILLYIKNNADINDFKNIPLTPTSYTWSGSVLPMYNTWLNYLKSLKSQMKGIKLLSHKQYIEERIDQIENRIKCQQIEEVLRD